MPATRIEPVGQKEIAERLKVSDHTVEQWVRRSARGELTPPFPSAHHTVSGRDAFDWPEVKLWYAAFKNKPRAA